MDPESWTDEDWGSFARWMRGRVDLLGASRGAAVLGFVLGFVVLVWGWVRRKQLGQFFEQLEQFYG